MPTSFAPGVARKLKRPPFEHQRGVGGVVNDHELVLFGERDRLGEELRRRARAGRVVRIIQHQHLGLLQHVRRHGIQVRQELVLLRQRQVVRPARRVLGVGAEHRVARHGHEHVVARVDERRRQDGQRGLAADGVDHLRLRVDALDAAHPSR